MEQTDVSSIEIFDERALRSLNLSMFSSQDSMKDITNNHKEKKI